MSTSRDCRRSDVSREYRPPCRIRFRLSRPANFWQAISGAARCVAFGFDRQHRSPRTRCIWFPMRTRAGRKSWLARSSTSRGAGYRCACPMGERKRLRPEQVERVETTRSAEHAAGDELFADGDFRQATAQYRAAVQGDREVRGWVRRQILGSDRVVPTGQRRLGRSRRDLSDAGGPRSRHAVFRLHPAGLDGGAARARAREQCPTMARPVGAAGRTIGRSHLLTTSHRAIALAKLESLQTSDRSADRLAGRGANLARRRRGGAQATRRLAENALKPVRRHCVPGPTTCSVWHASSTSRTRRHWRC